MIRALLFVASLALTLFSHAASVAEVLSQTGKASRELSYSGIVTFEYGASIQSLRVDHGVVDGKEYEVLTALNGAPYEIVRSGHAVGCVHPGDDQLRSGQRLLSAMFGQNPTTEPVESPDYVVRYKGKSRVAGRIVNHVVVHAKDKFRYGYKFFIDEETNLILKRIIFNEERKVFERVQFVDINFLDEVPESFVQSVAQRAESNQDIHGKSQSDLADLLHPNWLPSGFVASGSQGDRLSNLWTFSDGLASVSVVLEPVGPRTKDLRTEGRARRGATVAYTRPVLVAGQPYVLTVLGEVPIMTAAKISRHIRLK